MFAELIEKASEKVSDKSICESCGATFSCGASEGKCWCFSIEMKREKLIELKENYKSCLCENCLLGNDADKLTDNKTELIER